MRIPVSSYLVLLLLSPPSVGAKLGMNARELGHKHKDEDAGPQEDAAALDNNEDSDNKGKHKRNKHNKHQKDQDGNNDEDSTAAASTNTTKKHHDASPMQFEQSNVSSEPPPMDCGTFLIQDTEAVTIFDDKVTIDPADSEAADISDITCTELPEMDGTVEEYCFDLGGKDVAYWVQGKCNRGTGTTKVKFAPMPFEEDGELLFACGGSPRAVPSVSCGRCRNTSKDAQGDCEFGFRAMARFGIITIPAMAKGKCTLTCKMPTTDE